MKKIDQNCSRVHKQSGFTLLELLVALVLVMVILVSVQRYIAGVTIDHEDIAARRDQVTQMRVALSNIQRDVAQAGYFPYAESNAVPDSSTLGVSYSKGMLVVDSYLPGVSALDCNGHSKQYNKSAQQVHVRNVYELVADDDKTLGKTLKCDGNGGNSGRQPLVSHIEQMLITDGMGKTLAATGNQFVSVCLITSESKTSIAGASTMTMCDGSTAVPNNTDRVYYKMEVDMPVYTASFAAGQ